ncbi:MAG: redoxin domain-containing protein [Thermoguttaceae bacterium]
MHLSLRRFTAISLLGLAAFVGCSRSQPSQPKGGTPSDATAVAQPGANDAAAKPTTGRQVLERMAAVYRKASSYADHGTVRWLAEYDGRAVRDETAKFSLAIQRPNKIRVEAYAGRLVCDGKHVFAAVERLPGQVLLTDAPSRLVLRSVFRDFVLTDALNSGFAGMMPQVMLLLGEKPMDALLDGGEEPVLSDSEQIDGRDCYRVKVARDGIGTTTFWIDQKTFVLRRVVLPTDQYRQMMNQEQPIDHMSMIADFPGAALDAPVEPAAFKYEVPKDAKVVPFLLPPSMSELLKLKTPRFDFQSLDGKAVTPDTIAGKVAVFGFWSVRYPECKQSLLDLDQVYQRYKDNPKVAFYAVCIDPMELKNSDATRALDDLKVRVPLLRDAKQSAAALRLAAPPALLVINDKGIVQHCERGARPDLVKSLPQRIDKLLAGEDVSADAQMEYQQQLDFLTSFAKGADKPEESLGPAKPAAKDGASGDTVIEEMKLPETKVAPRTEPTRLKLSPLWKCTEVKSPGNLLVLTGASPRLLAVENYNSLAEVGPDGKVLARHPLGLAPQEYVGCLRTAVGADGRRYCAAFLWSNQRCHVLDDKWNVVAHYPQDALQNPHSGITDVQLGDVDGSGQLKLYVSYGGVVGVQCVALDGKRIWSNRQVSNVSSISLDGRTRDGRNAVVCANAGATLNLIDAAGKLGPEIHVDRDSLRRILAAKLRGSETFWCGSVAEPGLTQRFVGFSLDGKQLWSYTLPEGVPSAIEPIIAGQLTRDGQGQWLLPGPDGSIHILAADGSLLDKFNYGDQLQGLATAQLGGHPALIVATAKGLEAWRVSEK